MPSYRQLLYHIILRTKSSRKSLTLEDSNELYAYLMGAIKNKKCFLYRINGMEDHVHFAGLLTDPEIVGKYYLACDVFVLTSRATPTNAETFGIVYLEANAYGKPVVAGDSGGVRDAVADGVNGFLVDAEDHVAVAERLARLLKDHSLREKMAQAGRRRIAEQFNWATITTRLESFWDHGSIGN